MTVTINTIAGDDFVDVAEHRAGLDITGTVSGRTAGTFATIHVAVLDSAGTTVFATDGFGPDNGNWEAVLPYGSLPHDGSFTIVADCADDDTTQPATRNINADVTPPQLLSMSLSDASLGPGETAIVTLKFTEPVNLTPANFHTNFGAVSNLTAQGDNTYVGVFTPFDNVETRSGRLTLDTSYTDAAGNVPDGPSTFVPYVADTKPPTPGTAFFQGLDDTGTHETPIVTSDNSFMVNETGADDLNFLGLYAERSVNGAAFQPLEGFNEVQLPDGDYRYRFVVTDSFGNTSRSNVIEVIIDTVAPAVGTLAFANLVDSGSLDATPVTTDNSFDLALTGTDAGASVSYQVSVDGGAHWVTTAASQTNLSDRTYQFRAIALDPADKAGNVSISNVLVVTIDHVAVPGTLAFANLTDTGSADTPAVTSDNNFDLVLTGSEAGASAVYQVSTDGGASWSPTTAHQPAIADASYLFRATETDAAGNVASGNTIAVIVDHRAPAAGTLAFAGLDDGGPNGITTDHAFGLSLSGTEPGAIIAYQLSGDGGASWLTTGTDQSLPDGSYLFRAFATDSAGNIATSNQLALTVTQKQAPPGEPPQAPQLGTDGDDTFTAPSGSASIDARGGTDTIVFGFRLVDATISFAGNHVIVDGPSSHTVLSGFEIYAFTDGTVNDHDGSSPLVDDLFYYARYHDVWNAHADADAHYAAIGWREGRDPDAFFDTRGYLAHYADVAAAGVNPLTHYDQYGWREGRDPSTAFDTGDYLMHYGDVAAAHIDPLAHFLGFGGEEGRTPFTDGAWG
jgi:hypothetical protein